MAMTQTTFKTLCRCTHRLEYQDQKTIWISYPIPVYLYRIYKYLQSNFSAVTSEITDHDTCITKFYWNRLTKNTKLECLNFLHMKYSVIDIQV